MSIFRKSEENGKRCRNDNANRRGKDKKKKKKNKKKEISLTELVVNRVLVR